MNITPTLTGQELAKAVIEKVEREPESHNQTLVLSDCGSVGCLSGWAVAIALGVRTSAQRYSAQELYADAHGIDNSNETVSAHLLGVDVDDFTDLVFDETSKSLAIGNLKALVGLDE